MEEYFQDEEMIESDDEEGTKMDQVVAFGKKYGKWIAGAVVASAVAVAAYLVSKTDDDNFVILEESVNEETADADE